MGNHDSFSFSEEEFYGILSKACKPPYFSHEEKTFLFLNACYFKNGNRYTPDGGGWKDAFIPDLRALEKRLQAASGDCYVFMHQNVDAEIRADHRIYNDLHFAPLSSNQEKSKPFIKDIIIPVTKANETASPTLRFQRRAKRKTRISL